MCFSLNAAGGHPLEDLASNPPIKPNLKKSKNDKKLGN